MLNFKVINIDSHLKLRSSANSSSEENVIAKLSNGTHLLSIKRAVNGNWNQVVTDDGTIGYVSGDYLQFVSDVTNCNTNKTVITNDGIGVKVRCGPSTTVDQVTSVPDGTVVTVINTGTYNNDGYAWDRVILNGGTQGFVAAKFLK